MAKWISVKERLPKNRDTVLVCDKFGSIKSESYLPDKGFWGCDCDPEYGFRRFTTGDYITHWMPIPVQRS